MNAPYIINATAKQTATVIFLHGLGDTGVGWYSAFQEISRPYIKYIFPNAPESPVTLNGGAVMPSWFDLISLSINGPEDEKGIQASCKSGTHIMKVTLQQRARIRDLITTELDNGIESNRIMLGGFSQGGAISLNTALTYEKKLAGVIGLSTWLANRNSVLKEITVNKDIPIFQGHGDCDPLININYGLMTKQMLSSINPNVKFTTYAGMMHSSCAEEMIDVKNFIDERLPNQ